MVQIYLLLIVSLPFVLGRLIAKQAQKPSYKMLGSVLSLAAFLYAIAMIILVF